MHHWNNIMYNRCDTWNMNQQVFGNNCFIFIYLLQNFILKTNTGLFKIKIKIFPHQIKSTLSLVCSFKNVKKKGYTRCPSWLNLQFCKTQFQFSEVVRKYLSCKLITNCKIIHFQRFGLNSVFVWLKWTCDYNQCGHPVWGFIYSCCIAHLVVMDPIVQPELIFH